MDVLSLHALSPSHLQGDEPAVKRNEQRLSALKELSSRIPPLKERRVFPSKPTTVVSLCDWVDRDVRLAPGFTFKTQAVLLVAHDPCLFFRPRKW